MVKEVALIALLGAAVANADMYMHNPRGSNNRLNEKSANRNNGNRLFDSQNNNRGGYNVGDRMATAFNPNDNAPNEYGDANGQFPGRLFKYGLDKGQYAMVYYEGSKLPLEWTNQHGCGGNERSDPNKLNCNMVIQYMCNTDNSKQTQPALQVQLKDGRNTNTPDDANNMAESRLEAPGVTMGAKVTQNNNNARGRHEGEAWYYECEQRERNKGLFTADQNVKGNKAKYTRQNPNGNRRGLECPEERDYFPYWMPTPWVDIAYLTSNVEDCSGAGGFDVLGNSMNTNEKFRCSYDPAAPPGMEKAWTEAAKMLTKEQCDDLKTKAADFDATPAEISWKGYTHGVKAPECGQAAWSRVNHLGNGVDGQANSYNWTLPMLSTGAEGVGKYTDTSGNMAGALDNHLAKCIVRMRYNISTDDYDVRQTNSSFNANTRQGKRSPVEQNPTVDVGAALQGLQLAINTAQFGRTFQDRSHTFYIRKRLANMASAEILNLNVRGKRGNIVQTFPSVEYDFIPNRVHVPVNSFLHVQWTGSNTHNNGNPAGDGQAGDAGEGTGGTDRHNMVPIADLSKNFPIAQDATTQDAHNFMKKMECYDKEGNIQDWLDCAVALSTSNYWKTKDEAQGAGAAFNPLLNNAPASLDMGIFLKATTRGPFHYMCTRNNNFSNRSQKGTIIVE